MKYVTLSPVEINLAKSIAQARHYFDDANGVQEKLVGDPAKVQELEFIGVGGEIAFAKWMNVFPNISTVLVPDAPDYVIHGIAIDVKSSDRPDGDLIIPIHKKQESAGVYVYLNGSLDRGKYDLVGWTTAKVAFQKKYERDLGRGLSRVIPRKSLYPCETLPKALDMMSRFNSIHDYFKNLNEDLFAVEQQ